MATLPRAYNSKHSPNMTAPFSTSPRRLQEMTLPIPDRHADITAASGISMKQYEEELNGFRKENFNLKLRIYFLEEKLGSGAPPAVQGLLEHNVRLQVEVEELRRQLTDKQELLAAAAEAIDVLEQQGSMSTDSVEASMDNCTSVQAKSLFAENQQEKAEQPGYKLCLESESTLDIQDNTTDNQNMDELMKLRRENRKALQMIKSCLKKIQQQDKQIKKLKLDKELTYAHVSDSHLQKYEEIIQCKDKHIKELETKIKDLQKSLENVEVSSGNLPELLAKRLQGSAYFLDKLLSHKCVLGEDKKKLAQSILEESLTLPPGFKLDESSAPGDLTMDESNVDISQSLRLEDLTMMFAHHMNCSDDNRLSRKPSKNDVPQADALSESECWSEPDRNVSMQRIGLCDMIANTKEPSELNKFRARRSRISYGSRSDDRASNEAALLEEIQQLEQNKKDLIAELDSAKKQIKELLDEKETLTTEREKQAADAAQALLTLESQVKETKQQLSEAVHTIEILRTQKQDLEASFLETEHTLRRAADEATIQASQAALERARAQHDRLQIERELEEAREKLATALETNARLQMEATQRIVFEATKEVALANEEAQVSEDERPTSPDQGIDSDRLSSLEHAEPLSPRSLYEENITLKQKLARTKATLADTLAQLNAANMKKRIVQRAICREIHKTQGVLRKARDHLETKKPDGL